MIDSVACIGAGVVGRSWALAFARAGRDVAIYDANGGAAEAAIAWLGERRLAARVRAAASLADALSGSEFVQESINEDIEAKRALFEELDAHAGSDVPLASSTSAFPARRLFEGLKGAARCIVAHPINPPHLVPLVEIAPAPQTSEATLRRVEAFMHAIGQTPIRIRSESPGFVVNRLQMALLAEACDLVAKGVASVEDVDLAVRRGLALRWVLTGPFETAHLNADGGAREYFGKFGAAMNQLIEDLNRTAPLEPALIELIHASAAESGEGKSVAERQARRDQALSSLNLFLSGLGQAPARRGHDGEDFNPAWIG